MYFVYLLSTVLEMVRYKGKFPHLLFLRQTGKVGWNHIAKGLEFSLRGFNLLVSKELQKCLKEHNILINYTTIKLNLKICR